MQLRSLFTGSRNYLRAFDWLLGIASLGYGIYAHSWWWIAGGVIGLALAWYDPGTRIRRYFSVIKPASSPLPNRKDRRGT
jgi:hypothetical protein